MSIKAIKSEKSPAAIGPYSQAVTAGGFVFVSGMLPIDMSTGELELNCIKTATKNIFTNISKLLSEDGLTLADVAKTTVFMTDLSEFTDMNEVYATFFKDTPPSRSTIQVAALPKGVKIEIEAIALAK